MSRLRGTGIWLREVKKALEQLGGEATLAELYARIDKNYKEPKAASWKSSVRQTLQYYDPESGYYVGREPLFSRRGRGKWALVRR
jgi:hypothetical protein